MTWRGDTRTDSRGGITVIVPAFNEAGVVAGTIRSLQGQTVLPEEMLVVDDCSTDGTRGIAEAFGVTVLRPPSNTGPKAGAQTFALPHVGTELVVAVDADTVLAPDALERLLEAMKEESRVAAACGFVLPRRAKSMWERGRYVEYLFAFTFYKQVQDYYGRTLISSGCFSMYRTETLCRIGGWSDRTMAEDMDLTWSLYGAGEGVRFVPEAVCYPLEPHDFSFMRKQLRRWSHGFVQNVRLHWRGVLGVRYLRSVVAVAFWDAAMAPLAYFLLLPILAALLSPVFLVGHVIDAPALGVVFATTAMLWLLELVLLGIGGGEEAPPVAGPGGMGDGSVVLAAEALERVPLAASPVLLTLLVVVLVSAELLRLALRRPRTGPKGYRRGGEAWTTRVR